MKKVIDKNINIKLAEERGLARGFNFGFGSGILATTFAYAICHLILIFLDK